mgnify:CR=1 FL=1
MSYRRVYIGTFKGDRDLAAEITLFKETVVPAVTARGATSLEMVQTDNNKFVGTATYPDKATADANSDEIQSLRKKVIELFNLNEIEIYEGVAIVGL